MPGIQKKKIINIGQKYIFNVGNCCTRFLDFKVFILFHVLQKSKHIKKYKLKYLKKHYKDDFLKAKYIVAGQRKAFRANI